MEHYIEKPVAVESTRNVSAASLGTIHFLYFRHSLCHGNDALHGNKRVQHVQGWISWTLISRRHC
jgi:hypothetical protein